MFIGGAGENVAIIYREEESRHGVLLQVADYQRLRPEPVSFSKAEGWIPHYRATKSWVSHCEKLESPFRIGCFSGSYPA